MTSTSTSTSTRSPAVVAACVLASVAWLAAFAYGARTLALMPALLVTSSLVVVGVLAFVEPVRARLKPKLVDVLWGVAAGGVTLAATYALYPALRAVYPGVVDDVRLLYTLVPVTTTTLPIIVLVIIAEELLWRGALLEALRTDHPAATAVILASTLYAAAQLGLGTPILGAAALLLGLVWAALAAWTKSLVSSLVAHAMWTLTVFAAFPLERVAR